ncbi:hypothetical protein B566_EDAN004053 [Ephemera danica]|nr:hypothetical protein B566_EDAN004053 [Ephemera danica]
MSHSFRDRGRLGDRFKNKSGDEILQSLREQLDQDKKMFFDATPAWGETTSTTSPFSRQALWRCTMWAVTPYPQVGGCMWPQYQVEHLARCMSYTLRTRGLLTMSVGFCSQPLEAMDTFEDFDQEVGFPFDDVEDPRLPRSSRLQRHLDELASRHPEFADHLRPEMSTSGFRTWGPRHRRGSGGSSGVFSSEDDGSDVRSQASGGSGEGGIAAPPVPETESVAPQPQNKLPQYGLRNTVDLGGAAQKLEQSERNQRSWSAPPDARTGDPAQPKRFVSRIEITPKVPGNPNVQQCSQQQPPSPPIYSSSPGKPPMAPKPPPTNKAGSNVRHIPIFVEGRDEPVLPKDVTDSSKPAPTGAHASAHAEHFTTDFPGNPHFADAAFTDHAFSDHPFADRFSRPQFSNAFHHPNQFGPSPQQHTFRTTGFHPQPQQQQQPVPPQKRPTASQAPPTKRPTDTPAPSATAPPPPPQPPVNDPLAKVAAVQSNVDALTEQVSQFTGTTRTDKQYIYLDEMLTRNLIQLDDIETHGREDIRQARKDTIRSIQRAISLLESKAPNQDSTKTEEVAMETPEREEEESQKSGDADCESKSEMVQDPPSENVEQPAEQVQETATETNVTADPVAEEQAAVVKCSSVTAMEQDLPAGGDSTESKAEEQTNKESTEIPSAGDGASGEPTQSVEPAAPVEPVAQAESA